jgi:hypothetical protein
MKTKYEAYEIGTEVWAIAEYHKDGKPTPYVAIFQAKIQSVYVERDKKTGDIRVDYWLSTPDGKDWGDDVSEDNVSTDINDLIERMKPIWEAASNSHE